MLLYANIDVAGDADVECAGVAAHDVGVAGFHAGFPLSSMVERVERFSGEYRCKYEWVLVERSERFRWYGVYRGPSTAQLAKCASCFAQDDGLFVEGGEEHE